MGILQAILELKILAVTLSLKAMSRSLGKQQGKPNIRAIKAIPLHYIPRAYKEDWHG